MGSYNQYKIRVYAEHDTEYDYMDLSVLSECGFIHDTSRPITHIIGTSVHDVSDVYEHMFLTLCDMFEGVKRDVEAMK